MKKCIILLLLLLVIVGHLGFCQEEDKRGFIIRFDTGPAVTRYFDNDIYNKLEVTEGTETSRITLGLDFDLGWAITQNLYGLFVMEGIGDALVLENGSMPQYTLVFIGPGVLYFPMHTGLFIKGAFGLARHSYDRSYIDRYNLHHIGAQVAVGYDILKRSRGWSLFAAARGDFFYVYYDSTLAACLLLGVSWK